MNFNYPKRDGSAILVRSVCAIVFLVFTFLWLYAFQADVLCVAQHVLSGGRTSYKPLVGGVVITGLLMSLQLFVMKVFKLLRSFHWLTYLPSFLLLATISSIGIDCSFPLASHWWLLLLVLVVWAVAAWMLIRLKPLPRSRRSEIYSRLLWHNLLGMACLMLCIAVLGNTDIVFHFRAHAETSLKAGNVDEALRVGEESHENDGSLTMLRAYALSLKGELGDRLFHYPIAGTSDNLLPASSDSQLLIYPEDSLYRHLGARPVGQMSALRFFELLEKYGKATKAVADYRLCGLLIDRKLDEFASIVQRYYPLNDSLPRHYREALVLYRHQHSHPVVVYHDAVTDTDYNDLQELESHYADFTERKGKVLEKYEGSYWYYYEYMK